MVKGILFDIGGVLYVGERPISGAVEVVNTLKNRYKLRFLTNTTRKPPKSVYLKLQQMGFEISEDMLFTALSATKEYIEEQNGSVYTLLTNEASLYFKELESNNPDFVVVGDAYTNFNYENLNRAFRFLVDGSKLIGAAKNRFFKDSDNKLSMDAGGFIAALEYAASTKAKLIGKPNREFFLLACSSMNLEPSEVLMVGDDIEADIKGAKDAGLLTALVKSGKFREDDLKKGIVPDFIIEDVSKIDTILTFS